MIWTGFSRIGRWVDTGGSLVSRECTAQDVGKPVGLWSRAEGKMGRCGVGGDYLVQGGCFSLLN